MPPRDGEPADADDIWLRNVTDKKHVRPDGRPTSNAFTGSAISPRAPGRPWDYELSGKLLSLTHNFEAEGRRYCEQRNKPFIGVLYAKVERIRHEINGMKTDVHYTPNDNDEAHADLTTAGTNDDDVGLVRERLRDWLQEVLRVSKPEPKCVLDTK
jgi:hypothetical protein